MKSESIRSTENKEKFIINIVDISINTNAIILKAIHSNSFKRETIKTRIFILQIDNKITDVTRTFEKRKIRYVVSLLRKVTTKWTTIYIDQYEKIIFDTYQKFKKIFLKRFTDPNLIETIMKKLLNIRQEKLPI